MNKQIRQNYLKARSKGFRASEAWHIASRLDQWERLNYDDQVKLDAVPEQESYFDVYGEPEGYTDAHGRRVTAEEEREEIVRQIERDGCYCVVAYFRNADGKWEVADSVGMCTGYNDVLDPFENCYVADLMGSAIQAHQHAWEAAGEAV